MRALTASALALAGVTAAVGIATLTDAEATSRIVRQTEDLALGDSATRALDAWVGAVYGGRRGTLIWIKCSRLSTGEHRCVGAEQALVAAADFAQLERDGRIALAPGAGDVDEEGRSAIATLSLPLRVLSPTQAKGLSVFVDAALGVELEDVERLFVHRAADRLLATADVSEDATATERLVCLRDGRCRLAGHR